MRHLIGHLLRWRQVYAGISDNSRCYFVDA